MPDQNTIREETLKYLRTKADIEHGTGGGPAREVHQRGKRKPIGRYPSFKARRALTWESVHERQVMWQCEADPEIVHFAAQPHKVTIRLPEWDGKTMVYYPDLLRRYASGREEIIEVKKNLREIEDEPEYAYKLELAQMVYEAKGYNFKILTAEDDIEIEPFLTNVQTIQRYRFTRINTLDRLKFHETLDAAGGPLAFARAVEAVSASRSKFDPTAIAFVYAMVVRREAWIDIRGHFGHDTPIRKISEQTTKPAH
jgi:hypothetical protein